MIYGVYTPYLLKGVHFCVCVCFENVLNTRWHQPIMDALVRLPPLSPGDAVFYHTGERNAEKESCVWTGESYWGTTSGYLQS